MKRHALTLLLCLPVFSGCYTRPPTIAHVHIGHAITGVHVTPGHKGYVLVAEQRATEGLTAAQAAVHSNDLPTLKSNVAAVVTACNDDDHFGIRESLNLAANHLTFAATSADASENVIAFAPVFKTNVAAVIARCDYIALLADDVSRAASMQEASAIAGEIAKASEANLAGDDSSGSGTRGALPADYGVTQLHAQLLAMLARERPAYRTVDEWYLFNLVRLPNGLWVFDKLGRGGNISGYK